MPASATHRRERAVLAALRAAGRPLAIRELVPLAVALGPDAPQILATIPLMLRAKLIVLAPGQTHGVRFQHLIVQLPPESGLDK